ncbi:hypothetical protein VD0002_g2845 [Verticillium dahliae]|nr:Rab guanine nucleotide exchange factor sec2 [Verticillium dahliae VDG2]PNH31137.1 hypothetical protein BJF96_g5597 [Verticillium dahliae]PNH41570.1 hypothetical protein VD0004_g5570 [Verticillium dahliae]PNH52778.1 hypothetical protein VD0003_g4564 [Verticillium dahliae]PNH66549.1 hypothetical protein VD0002_g2845 [Verticillium dahliae]
MRSPVHSLLFCLGLFVLLAEASPVRPDTRNTVQKRSFLVPRVKNENFQGHNGPRQLLRAYRKYSMPVPQGLEETVARQTAQAKLKARRGNGTGGVKATPIRNDVEYVSPIKIGGQTVTVDFDTGSSDLWVFTSQLGRQAQAGHEIYNPARSKTFSMLRGNNFDISYGDGSGAAGNVGTDVVDIGGATVTRQAIEMATALSASFVEDTANNGLMGLAFSKLNTVKPQKQKTFFDNVMPSLAEPVFTADLKKAAVGAYEFGRVDPAKFVGQMTYVPVNTSNGFWQFPSESFSVDGGAPQPGQAGGQAIADTGTTIILANPVTVEGYYAAVPGAVNDQQQGGFTFPCATQLPDLALDIGGLYMARVKGSDINFAQVSDTMCFGALQATTSDVQIYGDVMFKTQFVAFNGGNNSLGFAEHADGQGRPTQLGKQQQQKQGTGETQPLRGVVNESSAGPARAASLILVGAVPALTVILGWYI